VPSFDADDLDRADMFRQLITSLQKGQFFPSGRNNPAMRVGGEAGTPPAPIDNDGITRILDNTGPLVTFEGRTRKFKDTPGTAPPETSLGIWSIKRIENNNGLITTLFANDGKYDQIFDNRVSLFPTAFFRNDFSTDFDGINDYARITNEADLNFEFNNSFSISAWFKTSAGVSQPILSNYDTSGNLRGYALFLTTAGKLRFSLRSESGKNAEIETNTTFNNDAWHHVAVTTDGSGLVSGLKIFVDNADQAVTTIEDNLDPPASNTIVHLEDIIIGSNNNLIDFFTGRIDEISVWNKKLSPIEVSNLFSGGTPNDVNQHAAALTVIALYKMGDGDTFPTISDQSTAPGFATHDAAMTNMDSGDFVLDIPPS